MRQIGDMKLYSFDEVLDEDLGKAGTPERDAFEADVEAEIRAYHIGEAIKQARKEQNLTQEELGAKVGVKKSQISKLESGKCIITLPTMSRVFKALGIATATLDLGIGGKVALW